MWARPGKNGGRLRGIALNRGNGKWSGFGSLVEQLVTQGHRLVLSCEALRHERTSAILAAGGAVVRGHVGSAGGLRVLFHRFDLGLDLCLPLALDVLGGHRCDDGRGKALSPGLVVEVFKLQRA